MAESNPAPADTESLADMEAAASELIARFDPAPELWTLAPRGKWSGGRHVEHVASVHALFADALERAEQDLAAGTLAPPRRRGAIQSLFVRFMTRAKKFPRGGRAKGATIPQDAPERSATIARLRGEVARYRALVDRLMPEDRERLWARNPFVPFDWHYTLLEVMRVHARHTRHHPMLVDEITSRR